MGASDAAFWNRGVEAVPVTTGAATVMDCADLLEACARLGVDVPMRRVFDVGCGTGRWAAHCDGYTGFDVSADAVAYAKRNELTAHVIGGPDELPTIRMYRCKADADANVNPFHVCTAGWVTCFSVFTHIDRPARVAYLRKFRQIAPGALVDIIPGDGSGDVALWTAEPRDFVSDVTLTGWRVGRVYQRTAPDGVPHRYYRLEAV